MNHLAHLFLAGDDADSLIGNLSGDFVKGPLGDRFTEAIRRGVMEHRRIDTFTDSHPAAADFRRILVPEHGHYARIIADVFFDHFLASTWHSWSDEPLSQFVSRVFAMLDPRIGDMPERLARTYPHMRDGRWFLSYATILGIERALTQMSGRLARPHRLETAVRHLTDSRPLLESHFRRFFPDVIEFARGLR